MFAQMLQNPKVEVFAMSEFGAARFMAEAVEETDEAKAREAFEKMEKPMDENSVAMRLSKIRKAQ